MKIELKKTDAESLNRYWMTAAPNMTVSEALKRGARLAEELENVLLDRGTPFADAVQSFLAIYGKTPLYEV